MTHVLIVEDEEALADPLAFLLRKEGFEASVINDGAQALAAFERINPDIVLLDVMLPGMSGTEICRALRAVRGSSDYGDRPRFGGRQGGRPRTRRRRYVTKPYSARELIARIRAVLRRGSEPADDDSAMVVLEAGPSGWMSTTDTVAVDGK